VGTAHSAGGVGSYHPATAATPAFGSADAIARMEGVIMQQQRMLAELLQAERRRAAAVDLS